MTESEFEIYRARLIREYAADKVRSGNWSVEESLSRSEKETDQLLSKGLATPDHYLFSIHDAAMAKNVGILWFAIVHWGGQRLAFIYDVEVNADDRGKGYGSQALTALEDKVKALGLDRIQLHVFGHNQRARQLYEKLGYEITNINMAKKLA
ncbi:MAG: GNAT family N-acetyltransferase [Chloroflexi bacterium]|nr:GNAT family N-acetyltransferase [Chloroflexota bacterium]